MKNTPRKQRSTGAFRVVASLGGLSIILGLAQCSSEQAGNNAAPATSAPTLTEVAGANTGGQGMTPGMGMPPQTGGTVAVAGSNPGSGGSPPMTSGGAGGSGMAEAGSGGETMIPPEVPPLGDWPPPAVKLTKIADADLPTAIVQPPGDPTRLFFTEVAGRVRVIKDGQLLPQPALDINEKVLVGDPIDGAERPAVEGKRGLIGLAFHPNYAENGRVFVMYAADQGEVGRYGSPGNQYDDGDTYFEEYRRSANNPDVFDPEPVTRFLEFDKGTCSGCKSHNGGSLEIGPDGFLYASTGDPPPYEGDSNESQNPMSLMGKILRFDITGDVQPAGGYPGGHPAVWDIGLRNAYKFSFDRVTGDMYVGDVGEVTWEEVSVKPWGQLHKNFQWPMLEGTHNYLPSEGECGDDCVPSLIDYGRDEGQCVIGGYVYRGSAIPGLQGTYLYGDYQASKLFALQAEGGQLVNGPITLPHSIRMGCFGQDLAGELYICDYRDMAILRVEAE